MDLINAAAMLEMSRESASTQSQANQATQQQGMFQAPMTNMINTNPNNGQMRVLNEQMNEMNEQQQVALSLGEGFFCKARGMPSSHSIRTALFEISPDTPHGHELICSHQWCASQGVKFRFCKVCKVPVAKRNFRKRHMHADLPLPYTQDPRGAQISFPYRLQNPTLNPQQLQLLQNPIQLQLPLQGQQQIQGNLLSQNPHANAHVHAPLHMMQNPSNAPMHLTQQQHMSQQQQSNPNTQQNVNNTQNNNASSNPSNQPNSSYDYQQKSAQNGRSMPMPGSSQTMEASWKQQQIQHQMQLQMQGQVHLQQQREQQRALGIVAGCVVGSGVGVGGGMSNGGGGRNSGSGEAMSNHYNPNSNSMSHGQSPSQLQMQQHQMHHQQMQQLMQRQMLQRNNAKNDNSNSNSNTMTNMNSAGGSSTSSGSSGSGSGLPGLNLSQGQGQIQILRPPSSQVAQPSHIAHDNTNTNTNMNTSTPTLTSLITSTASPNIASVGDLPIPNSATSSTNGSGVRKTNASQPVPKPFVQTVEALNAGDSDDEIVTTKATKNGMDSWLGTASRVMTSDERVKLLSKDSSDDDSDADDDEVKDKNKNKNKSSPPPPPPAALCKLVTRTSPSPGSSPGASASLTASKVAFVSSGSSLNLISNSDSNDYDLNSPSRGVRFTHESVSDHDGDTNMADVSVDGVGDGSNTNPNNNEPNNNNEGALPSRSSQNDSRAGVGLKRKKFGMAGGSIGGVESDDSDSDEKITKFGKGISHNVKAATAATVNNGTTTNVPTTRAVAKSPPTPLPSHIPTPIPTPAMMLTTRSSSALRSAPGQQATTMVHMTPHGNRSTAQKSNYASNAQLQPLDHPQQQNHRLTSQNLNAGGFNYHHQQQQQQQHHQSPHQSSNQSYSHSQQSQSSSSNNNYAHSAPPVNLQERWQQLLRTRPSEHDYTAMNTWLWAVICVSGAYANENNVVGSGGGGRTVNSNGNSHGNSNSSNSNGNGNGNSNMNPSPNPNGQTHNGVVNTNASATLKNNISNTNTTAAKLNKVVVKPPRSQPQSQPNAPVLVMNGSGSKPSLGSANVVLEEPVADGGFNDENDGDDDCCIVVDNPSTSTNTNTNTSFIGIKTTASPALSLASTLASAPAEVLAEASTVASAEGSDGDTNGNSNGDGNSDGEWTNDTAKPLGSNRSLGENVV